MRALTPYAFATSARSLDITGFCLEIPAARIGSAARVREMRFSRLQASRLDCCLQFTALISSSSNTGRSDQWTEFADSVLRRE